MKSVESIDIRDGARRCRWLFLQIERASGDSRSKQVITCELPDTDTLSANSEESLEERARKMPVSKPGVR